MAKERVDSDKINYLVWRYVVLSSALSCPVTCVGVALLRNQNLAANRGVQFTGIW